MCAVPKLFEFMPIPSVVHRMFLIPILLIYPQYPISTLSGVSMTPQSKL